MTTSSQIHPPTQTAIECPSWCTVNHADTLPGSGFHAGPTFEIPAAPGIVKWDGVAGRLWQADSPGAQAGVVVAGQEMREVQAHDSGMAIVRAADVLRRERMAQS